MTMINTNINSYVKSAQLVRLFALPVFLPVFVLLSACTNDEEETTASTGSIVAANDDVAQVAVEVSQVQPNLFSGASDIGKKQLSSAQALQVKQAALTASSTTETSQGRSHLRYTTPAVRSPFAFFTESTPSNQNMQSPVPVNESINKELMSELTGELIIESQQYGQDKPQQPKVGQTQQSTQAHLRQLQSSIPLPPDADRPRQALEGFELLSLKYKGVMQPSDNNNSDQSEPIALIERPDGVTMRVQVGQYVGKNSGKIVSINSQKIVLREWVFDGKKYRQQSQILAVDSGL